MGVILGAAISDNHASRGHFTTRLFLSAHDTTTNSSMDTDVSTLRAQLKAFEREFKARHHRPPSVNDIKDAGFGAT